jgi:hypothetical protein
MGLLMGVFEMDAAGQRAAILADHDKPHGRRGRRGRPLGAPSWIVARNGRQARSQAGDESCLGPPPQLWRCLAVSVEVGAAPLRQAGRSGTGRLAVEGEGRMR